ncbi:MAG: hypothetical protein KDA22_05905 [Phycisphaerales bacterium]|nr:hypothetical protein [Phycisphaerales bacterium]
MADPQPTFRETCLHLRHKLMYVDVAHMTPGLVDDSSGTRLYWCQLTQDCRGPDGGAVTPSDCSAARPCHCGRTLRPAPPAGVDAPR